MKLKFGHRIVLYACALVLLALGAAAIVGSLTHSRIVFSAEGQSYFTLGRLGFVAGGVALLGIGFFCLSLPNFLKPDKHEHILQKTETGDLRISTQAIEALVLKSLSQHEEIKLQQLSARQARNGVIIELKASIANNINMPLAISAISRHIRQQLLATTGVEARDISVTIVKADQSSDDSPYLVKPADLSLPKEIKPLATKKQSEHQQGAPHGEV